MEDSHITLKVIDKSGSTLSETTCELTENNLTCLIACLKKVQVEVNNVLTLLVENSGNGTVPSGDEEDSEEDEESEEEKDLPLVKKLKTC